MELIRADQIPALSNPGVVSRQLLNPESAPDARVTVTEVHLSPDGVQPRHIHERAEQIWYALRGRCALLLALGEETPFHAGDVVRFAPGDVHGARNDGDGEFVYVSVTTPPQSFEHAYQKKEGGA